MRQRLGSAGGSTLFEILATLAILALLLGMASLAAGRGIEQRRLSKAAETLLVDLREAQGRAVAERRPWRLTFAAGAYEVQHDCAVAHADCLPEGGWQTRTRGQRRLERLSWAEPSPADTVVTFGAGSGAVSEAPPAGAANFSFTLVGRYGLSRTVFLSPAGHAWTVP